MRDDYQAIRDKGAEVVAIGMGIPPMAAHFREEYEVPFPLVVDGDRRTYKALEIGLGEWWDVLGPPVWLRGIKGFLTGHPSRIPRQDPKQLGGVVVADQGGDIRFIHRSQNSSDNVPVPEVMEALP